LLKKLGILGLQEDVVIPIEVWVRDISYYLSIGGTNSVLFDLLLGTIHGSLLGSRLYAIYVSPLFGFEPISAYADSIPRWNKSNELLIADTEKSLEAITKWLRDSGLKGNQTKTEICLLYKQDEAPARKKNLWKHHGIQNTI
jgi:hypothetical protein